MFLIFHFFCTKSSAGIIKKASLITVTMHYLPLSYFLESYETAIEGVGA